MPDFTVIQVGTDTSGRPLYMTRYAWAVWKAVLADLEVQPFAHLIVIVQGAFMSRVIGGGADASAGYHDWAGCWDIRTWNLTKAQIDILIKALRRAGIAAWRRDLTALHGGMDPHIHVTFGDDKPLSGGAASSWSGYLRNENGLANGAKDYEWRPSPLVTKPPASLLEEDYMGTSKAEKDLAAIKATQAKIVDLLEAGSTTDQKRWAAERERDRADRERQSLRYQNLVSKIGGLADSLSIEDRAKVLAILRDENDVTGADNPAVEA